MLSNNERLKLIASGLGELCDSVVFVLNYSGEFKQQFFDTTDTELRFYLSDQFRALLNRPYIREEVSCSLTYGESEEADRILQIMKFVADG